MEQDDGDQSLPQNAKSAKTMTKTGKDNLEDSFEQVEW